jgi:hypothetical protein
MLNEGHQVLKRQRVTALCGASLLITVACVTAAPTASAAPLTHASRAARTGIPSSAKNRLMHEMLSAWQITKGEGVKIAILSTGIAPVSGLAGKLTVGPDYAPLAGAPALDGTLLATLIAGSGPTGSNPFGSVGRAPGAKILAERIVDYGAGRPGLKYQHDGTWQSIEAKAIRYAVRHGASVIVNFEDGYADTHALASAVAYAISKNVVVLGSDSAFGSAPNSVSYPDSLPGVINFSGTTISGLQKPKHVYRSPVNDSVLVTAPDNVLPATGPGNSPYIAWGNYSTIAWVAGTVALIKSVYPKITPAEVARALATSASYHPKGGYNTRIGFGLINPSGALHAAAALVKLKTTAAAGPSVVASDARFAGSAPGVISAIQHSPAKLGAYGGSVVVGLALLILGIALLRRRRRLAVPAETALQIPPDIPSFGSPAT